MFFWLISLQGLSLLHDLLLSNFPPQTVRYFLVPILFLSLFLKGIKIGGRDRGTSEDGVVEGEEGAGGENCNGRNWAEVSLLVVALGSVPFAHSLFTVLLGGSFAFHRAAIATCAMVALALKSSEVLRGWDEGGQAFLLMAVGPLAVSMGSSMAQTQPTWVGILLFALVSGTEWGMAVRSQLREKVFPVASPTKPSVATVTPSIIPWPRPERILDPMERASSASSKRVSPPAAINSENKSDISNNPVNGTPVGFKSPLRAGRSTKRRITLGVGQSDLQPSISTPVFDMDDLLN